MSFLFLAFMGLIGLIFHENPWGKFTVIFCCLLALFDWAQIIAMKIYAAQHGSHSTAAGVSQGGDKFESGGG